MGGRSTRPVAVTVSARSFAEALRARIAELEAMPDLPEPVLRLVQPEPEPAARPPRPAKIPKPPPPPKEPRPPKPSKPRRHGSPENNGPPCPVDPAYFARRWVKLRRQHMKALARARLARRRVREIERMNGADLRLPAYWAAWHARLRLCIGPGAQKRRALGLYRMAVSNAAKSAASMPLSAQPAAIT